MSDTVLSDGLHARHFSRIAANGFGDSQNSYAHSMAEFGGDIYVGTSRHILALLKLFPPADAASMDPWPVKVPQSVEQLDLRAQIWRWHPQARCWERAHTSPEIDGRNGRAVPRDLGYRGMAVFRGRSDVAPALYVSCLSSVSRGTGARILRSPDGITFDPVGEPGLGNPNVSTFRSLVAFDDHLFVAPAGEGTTWNVTRAPTILRSPDPARGEWTHACVAGFGDPTNGGIFELEAFNGHLYAGTFNHILGHQIWKTPATGTQPCRWTKVLERGGYRGSLNEMAMSMCAFNGALYVGSGLQNGGYDRTYRIGPAAGELIRIYPDDTWDLVVGTARDTPQGRRLPISGLGCGFDNFFNGYIWRMVVHDGWLYVGYFRLERLPAVRTAAPHAAVVTKARRRARRGRDRQPSGRVRPLEKPRRRRVEPRDVEWSGKRLQLRRAHAAFIASGSVCRHREPVRSGGARAAGARLDVRRKPGWRGGSVAGERRRPGRVPPAEGGSVRVLLTGATGFVGSEALGQLLERGDHVRVLALPDTIESLRDRDRVDVVAGSLSDAAALGEATRGVEVVYHLAAIHLSALRASANPRDLRIVNVEGTGQLLRACAANGVRRVVFTSSVAVYNAAPLPFMWPIHETYPLRTTGEDNLRNYALSKIEAEDLIRRAHHEHGVEAVILRSAAVYGPEAPWVDRMLRALAANPASALTRAGQFACNQWIHRRDLARAVVTAGAATGLQYQLCNVAGPELFSARHLLATMARVLGDGHQAGFRTPDLECTARYGYRYDVTRAEMRLGFAPRVKLEAGLGEVLAAMSPPPEIARAPRDPAHASPFAEVELF